MICYVESFLIYVSSLKFETGNPSYYKKDN